MKSGADGGGCFPTGKHYPGIAHLLKVVATGLAGNVDPHEAVRDLRVVSIDTETTGRSPDTDRIVEIGCVFVESATVTKRLSWLVNPGMPIPEDARAVHGISDEDVKDKPTFEQILPEFEQALRGYIPLAYNAEFDRNFILAEVGRCRTGSGERPPALDPEVEWLDPLTWAREIQKSEKSRALGDVCQRLGIELEHAHRATDDAEAAAHVLLRFLDDPKVPGTYAAFMQEQRRLSRRFAEQRLRWRRN